MKANRQINIRITENTYQLLRLRSYYDNRSMTDLINEAISKHIKPVVCEHKETTDYNICTSCGTKV